MGVDLLSAVSNYRNSKTNFFSFLKKFGARQQKNVEKIFLFWTQTSLKFAGGKRSGAKTENFLQKFSWKKVRALW
ncbi:hypothetical protein K0B03_01745 [Patescibacteria group bacterium]|nr:hypothetical protein [Patescibacteria group bacterium]